MSTQPRPAGTVPPPTMPLAMALAALEALHHVCLAMDMERQAERPSEDEYQAAMAHAAAVLAAAQGAKSLRDQLAPAMLADLRLFQDELTAVRAPDVGFRPGHRRVGLLLGDCGVEQVRRDGDEQQHPGEQERNQMQGDEDEVGHGAKGVAEVAVTSSITATPVRSADQASKAGEHGLAAPHFEAPDAQSTTPTQGADHKVSKLLNAARKLHELKFFDDIAIGATAEERRAMGAMRKALRAFDEPNVGVEPHSAAERT